jgi:hypothetical protein
MIKGDEHLDGRGALPAHQHAHHFHGVARRTPAGGSGGSGSRRAWMTAALALLSGLLACLWAYNLIHQARKGVAPSPRQPVGLACTAVAPLQCCRIAAAQHPAGMLLYECC